jgi:hypothetical protein
VFATAHKFLFSPAEGFAVEKKNTIGFLRWQRDPFGTLYFMRSSLYAIFQIEL